MPQVEANRLLGSLKQFLVAKSDVRQCSVCMSATPHPMRIQRLVCACKACNNIPTSLVCPWRGRVMTCQQSHLVTVEEAYTHATQARVPRDPVLTDAMKAAITDWASQGLKPKRIWNALIQLFNLTEASAPPLIRVQRFAHYHVAQRLGGSDLRSAVHRKVQETLFTGQEEETTAFTFTKRTDVDGNAVIGNGSDADPFVIGISSKKLLRRADRDPASFILHVDATYKLTQVGYPVIVVGISDRARHFHLLAVFIASQQQQEQHTEVLQLLRRLFNAVVGKPLCVRYVMGDADAAQWNAVEEVFGEDCEFIYLMCYFHVAKKIFEKTRSLGVCTATSVMTDIHDLHYASSDASFQEKLSEVQKRWAKRKDLEVFSKYFSKVWLNERFKRWQCFHTPCGYATTNNPCETFNAAIKRDVTLRRKLKIGALIPLLRTLCESESVAARPFVTSCEPEARLVRRVKAMARANLLSVYSASRTSIAFLLSDTPEKPSRDSVHVVSRPSPRVYDETRKKTIEDLPISAQLNKLTANMETHGMPASGWSVDIQARSCPCNFWFKYGSCIHTLYALEIHGSTDIHGRETLVNRGGKATKVASGVVGRPRNAGPALEREYECLLSSSYRDICRQTQTCFRWLL